MDVNSVTAVLGALGIGSLLTRMYDTNKDRRATRAGALSALSRVETARWVRGDDHGHEFASASEALVTACLLAQVPRKATTEYLINARAAYWLSAESWDEHWQEEDRRGGIDSAIADVARDAARMLADVIWAPPLKRRRLASRAEASLANHPRLEDADAPELRKLKHSRTFGAVA